MADAAHAVEFEESTHTYRVDGEVWPSVTTVLDPLLELDGIPKDVLRAAAEFGNHVHLACHLWDLGQLDEDALDTHLKPYLEGWKAFLRDSGAIVVNSELRVVSYRLRYAGTLDKVILWRGRKHVLDIKTSAVVPPTVGPQTAAYRQAYIELGSDVCSTVRYCVHLRRDGTYRSHKLEHNGPDFALFVSALNIHKWRDRHGRQPC